MPASNVFFSNFTANASPALSDYAVGYNVATSGGEKRWLLSSLRTLFQSNLGTAAFTNSTAYEVPLTFLTGLARTGNTINVNASLTFVTGLGTIAVGTWQGNAIADAYLANAATWNAKESALIFSTGLTRSANTITVNAVQSQITGVGTLTAGTWNANAIADAYIANAATWNAKQSLLIFSTGLTNTANTITVNLVQTLSSVTSPTATDLTLAALNSNCNVVVSPSGSGVFKVLVGDAVLTSANAAWAGWSAIAGRGIYIQRDGVSGVQLLATSNASTSLIGGSAGGTIAGGLSATQSGFGFIPAAAAYDGATWYTGARIQLISSETQSANARGHIISFDTILAGATTLAERFRVSGAGNLLIGGTTDTGLTGSGGLKVFSSTAASNTATGALLVSGGAGIGGSLYAANLFSHAYEVTNEIPVLVKNVAYTTTLADAGRMIYHTNGNATSYTWTIDSYANVPYANGTAISWFNDSAAANVTIAIAGGDTLMLAGAGTTGSRTLTANGIATAVMVQPRRWSINGTGLV